MKKIFLFFILWLACLPFAAFGLEVPKLEGYVNDYAGMISPSVRSKIEKDLRAFEESDSTQIVILTVPSLEGENIEEFGIKVAEAWKVGHQGKDNGVLFIVSKQERKVRIEVGRGLEGKLTDLMAGRIIDQAIKPRFKQGDFDGGFITGVSALIAGARGEFKAEKSPIQRKQKGFPPILTLLIFLGVFTLILGSISRILGGITAAIGLPAFVYLAILPVGILAIFLLALVGLGAGLFLPSLFLSGVSQRGGHRDRGSGFFFGPGTGSSIGGGGFNGGFSGGGGSFGGGGASGDW
ncbi:MAG: methanol dehydrogenase [Deltaproteobacteria bacterium RBG_16_49_23]|nr:MAG: methanol dehydrogenase [Deltaproteobacteria bacterium RBG_16_49_23]